ncbi:MAG TPA: DMT family transporter [Micromonosporaceae bacterium]
MLLVVGLSLLAAFLFATAASLQQHAARRTGYARVQQMHAERHVEAQSVGRGRSAGRDSVILGLFALVRRLVRMRLWLVGWGTNLAGFVVQAAALHVGSVAVVQPVLVTQLLFSLPLASMWSRRWPLTRDWAAGAGICAGLILFLAVRGAAPLSGSADRHRAILAGLAAICVVVLLVLLSTVRQPVTHAMFLAIAAGVCFAMSAVLMKLTTDDLLYRGVAHTAADWPGYALAVSTTVGLLLEQGAFAAGSLPGAIAAMTIANPLVSYVVGVLAFHAVPPTDPGAIIAVVGAAALLCLGVVGLAHSPSVRGDVPSEQPYDSPSLQPARPSS